jgi:hypothetical protein
MPKASSKQSQSKIENQPRRPAPAANARRSVLGRNNRNGGLALDDPAVVKRLGQVLSVRPSCEDILSVLHTRRLLPDPMREGQFTPRREPLYETDDFGWYIEELATVAGLEDVVLYLLMKEGRRIRWIRSPNRARPLKPSHSATSQMADPAVLDFVSKNECGLLRFDSRSVDPVRLVADVALALPKRSFAIVDPRINVIQRFTARLRRLVPEARWTSGDSYIDGRVRVLVSTPQALGYPSIDDLKNRDIVICLDPVAVTPIIPCWIIQHATRARIFGFLDREAQPAPRDADRMKLLFGFRELDIPRHGCVFRPVHASFLKMTGGPELSPALGTSALCRVGYWNHPVRNRRIARVARAIAGGDRGELLSLLLPNVTARLERLRVPRIAVVVANVDHALALARKLAEWPLITDRIAFPDGFSHTSRTLLEQRTWDGKRLPNQMIITLAALEQFNAGRLDVVIRADGGRYLPPQIERLAIIPNRRVTDLELIDCDDHHHPVLRKWSRTRQAAYDRRGWIGEKSMLNRRIDEFLATRPEVSWSL